MDSRPGPPISLVSARDAFEATAEPKRSATRLRASAIGPTVNASGAASRTAVRAVSGTGDIRALTYRTASEGGVSKETVRQWMREAGLWRARRQRVEEVHRWRPRRERCGELVQWDT